MQISKNGKNLLFSIILKDPYTIKPIVLLTDHNLNIVHRYECPIHSNNLQA